MVEDGDVRLLLVLPIRFYLLRLTRFLDVQVIYIDAVKNTIDMRVSDEELERRRKEWKPREPKVKQVKHSLRSQFFSLPLLTFLQFAN